jgi:hypothetical protein
MKRKRNMKKKKKTRKMRMEKRKNLIKTQRNHFCRKSGQILAGVILTIPNSQNRKFISYTDIYNLEVVRKFSCCIEFYY